MITAAHSTEPDGFHASTHSARQVLSILRKHAWKSVLALTAILAITWLVLIFAPRKYQSSAQYLVRLGHESVSLDPVATVGETMGLYMTSDSVVRSTREIISSEALADRLVARLGAAQILNDSVSSVPFLQSVKEYWRSIDLIKDDERARVLLRKNLSVTSPNQSNVISVSYQSPSPQLSFKVMETLSELFLEEHSRINRTEGSLAFFEEQERFLNESLTSATENLKNAKQKHGISSIEGKRESLERHLSETRTRLFNNLRDQAASDSRIEQLNTEIAATPTDLVLSSKASTDQQTNAAMRQQLYDLQIKEKELQSRFSDDHPGLQSVRKQLKEAEAIFAKMNLADSETSRGVNPVYQQLTLQLLTERANNASLVASTEILNQQLNTLENELRLLSEQEQELFHLQTQLEIVRSKVAAHAEKLEQARLEHELGSKAITSIGVIERPRVNERPSSPNKVVTIALGLLIGLLAAFCLPFGIEYLRDDAPPSRSASESSAQSKVDSRLSKLTVSPARDAAVLESAVAK